MAKSLKDFLRGVEETWLKPNLDFVIQGYACIRRDRERGNGGRYFI